MEVFWKTLSRRPVLSILIFQKLAAVGPGHCLHCVIFSENSTNWTVFFFFLFFLFLLLLSLFDWHEQATSGYIYFNFPLFCTQASKDWWKKVHTGKANKLFTYTINRSRIEYLKVLFWYENFHSKWLQKILLRKF